MTLEEAKRKRELEEKLVIGAKIRIGPEYAKKSRVWMPLHAGQVLELVEGTFEYDNGLYEEVQRCASVWNEREKDWESIYHLFGNDLEYMRDCEVIP